MRPILYLFLFLMLSSCSSVLDILEDNKFYYKNGNQRVQLDIEDEKTKNIHPIKIEASRIEGALKLILTRFGNKPQLLFPNEKVFSYSVAISEALKEAKPNQDVVFSLEGWYKQKGLSANRVTSGRIFYNKSGLNLIFGSILRQGEMHDTDPLLRGGLERDLEKNRYAPGSRFQQFSNKFRISALPNSGVFRPKSAVNRRDWLVFSEQALRARSFLSSGEQNLALKSNIEVENLRSEVENLRRELRTMSTSPYNQMPGNSYPRQNYQQTPYNMNVQRPNFYPNQIPQYSRYPNQMYRNQYQYPNQGQNIPPNNSLNNQLSLKSLESMRERGLISEESYFKKLKELGY